MKMKSFSSYHFLEIVVIKNAIHILFLVGLSSSLLLIPGISNAYKVDVVDPMLMEPEPIGWIRDASGYNEFHFSPNACSIPSGASISASWGYYYSTNSWKDPSGNIYSEALVHIEGHNIIDTRSAQGPVSAIVNGQLEPILFFI